jgi:hypothetical protein
VGEERIAAEGPQRQAAGLVPGLGGAVTGGSLKGGSWRRETVLGGFLTGDLVLRGRAAGGAERVGERLEQLGDRHVAGNDEVELPGRPHHGDQEDRHQPPSDPGSRRCWPAGTASGSDASRTIPNEPAGLVGLAVGGGQ